MHFVAMQLIMHMSMDITSLYPLPGAARGSTNGHILPVFTKVHIPRHNKNSSVLVLCQEIIIQITLPLLVMTTIVRVVLSTGKERLA